MTKRQEATREDVERFFGCLQGRFKILRQERHEWCDALVILIGEGFFILHNLIVRMPLAEEAEETALNNVYEQYNGNEGQDQNDSHVDTMVEEECGNVLNALRSRASLVSNRNRHIVVYRSRTLRLLRILTDQRRTRMGAGTSCRNGDPGNYGLHVYDARLTADTMTLTPNVTTRDTTN